jgi:type I restriction enzyme S subunit
MTKTKSLPPDLPPLPDHWEWKPLQELLQPQRNICYGVVQPGTHIVGGIPIVRAKGVKNGRVEEPDPLRIAPEIDAKHTKSRLIGGEILITLVGEYFGQVAVAPPTLAGFNTARAVGVVPVESDAQFISFALQAPVSQHYIKTWATTTAQPTLNLCDVAQLPIPMPPKWERDKIAHILGTLDDKIELNQQMNHTLESIARVLFKSWFIDFDPVRAKLDGRKPAGMDAETAALFPAEFEDSSLGRIPKGWKVKTLGDFIDIKHGYAFKGEFFRDTPPGDILLTPGNFAIGGGFKDDKFKYYVGEVPEEFVLRKGDLLVTMTDLSKLGDTLSYPAILPTEREGRYLHNQRLGKVLIKPENAISKLHLYYLLCTNEYRHEILASATGTTVKHTSPGRIQAFKFLAPPSEVSLEFDKVVSSFFEKILINNDENRFLTATRNALLPKLLAGKVPVKDIEKFLIGEDNAYV